MIEKFLNYIKYEKRYSDHTLVAYQHDLNQFQSFLEKEFEVLHLSEATYPMIRGWVVFLMTEGHTATSVNRKTTSLRSFFKFLLKEGVITENPMLRLKTPKNKRSLPVFVEESDMSHLLDHVVFEEDFSGYRDRIVLEILYGTGLRLSELINLKIGDYNQYDRQLVVSGKGNKQRIVPIHSALASAMGTYLEQLYSFTGSNPGLPFIVTDKGKEVYPMFIYRLVKHYLGQITTLEKKSPHVLRHTFATHLLNKGADLNAIKELLGHSSLAATQVYTHNSLEKLKSVFNQAHPKA